MSGGKKKQGQQGQKHQNKSAFKIMFNPLALEIHKKVSFRGLCKRCSGQITWKLQYNKYKRMTEPSRCALCQQKNVLRTYMTACEPCSETLKICPKCLDPESEQQVEVKLTDKQQKRQDEVDERKMNDFIKTLKERSRRTVKRLYQKGTIAWDPQLNNFLDQEGNTLPLQFRQGFGGNVSNAGEDEEQIDELEDEDEEQQEIDEDDEQQEKTSKDIKQKMKANKEQTDKQQEKDEDQDQEQHEEENSEQINEESDQQQAVQDGQNEAQQKNGSQQQKQSISANQNEQDWQDIDEEQDADDKEQQQQSEKEQEINKKKRKPQTHHHGKHHK